MDLYKIKKFPDTPDTSDAKYPGSSGDFLNTSIWTPFN